MMSIDNLIDDSLYYEAEGSMDALFNQKSISAFDSNQFIDSSFQEQEIFDSKMDAIPDEYDIVLDNDLQVDVDRAYLER